MTRWRVTKECIHTSKVILPEDLNVFQLFYHVTRYGYKTIIPTKGDLSELPSKFSYKEFDDKIDALKYMKLYSTGGKPDCARGLKSQASPVVFSVDSNEPIDLSEINKRYDIFTIFKKPISEGISEKDIYHYPNRYHINFKGVISKI